MGAAGMRLQLDPGRAIARAFDNAVARSRGAAGLFIDAHFFAAGPRLFADRQVDKAVVDRRHTHNQRPINLARGSAGKCPGEEGGTAGIPRDEQCARRILVQPVHELGPPLAFKNQRVEQPVNMFAGFGAALGRQSRWLVEHERDRVLVDDQFLREGDLVVAKRRAFPLFGCLGANRFGGWHP